MPTSRQEYALGVVVTVSSAAVIPVVVAGVETNGGVVGAAVVDGCGAGDRDWLDAAARDWLGAAAA